VHRWFCFCIKHGGNTVSASTLGGHKTNTFHIHVLQRFVDRLAASLATTHKHIRVGHCIDTSILVIWQLIAKLVPE